MGDLRTVPLPPALTSWHHYVAGRYSSRRIRRLLKIPRAATGIYSKLKSLCVFESKHAQIENENRFKQSVIIRIIQIHLNPIEIGSAEIGLLAID